jgi:DNA-directed RNA polymerase subunit RPC12/RpoP
MIKFRCSNCNKKFGVPDDYAGRRIRCNTCDQHTFVPKSAAQITILPSIPDRVAAEPSEVDGGVPASGGPMELSQKPQDAQIELQPPFQFEEFKLSPEEDLPPMDPNLEAIRQASRLRAQHSAETTKTDEKPERFPAKEAVASPDWYWPFVFPIRGAAMGMIGVFIVCEIVISFLAVIPIISLIVFLFSLIVRAYIFWYLYLCVQTAAEGKIRSPDILRFPRNDLAHVTDDSCGIFLYGPGDYLFRLDQRGNPHRDKHWKCRDRRRILEYVCGGIVLPADDSLIHSHARLHWRTESFFDCMVCSANAAEISCAGSVFFDSSGLDLRCEPVFQPAGFLVCPARRSPVVLSGLCRSRHAGAVFLHQ